MPSLRSRSVLLPAILLLIAPPLAAQGLRDKLSDLFRFGTCAQPLCLDVNAAIHGNHFIPGIVQGNNNLLAFLTGAIGQSLASIPLSAASSGATFTFEGGVPVKTSTSAGPVFGERAQTLGRGRFLVGTNVTGLHFQTLRGVPLNDLTLDFTHQDVGNTGLCDPDFECDIIEVKPNIDINLLVTTFYASYGLLDRVDVGIAVPLVRTSISGTSHGQIIPFGATTPHFFGTEANPSLEATAHMAGSAVGLGDIAARAKVNFYRSARVGFSVLGDVRFATGDDANLLGAGDMSWGGLGILSARYGPFSPHVNLGATLRRAATQANEVNGAFGFDQLLSSWATLAVDFIAAWQVGDSKVKLPAPTQLSFVRNGQTLTRTINHSNIPDDRDDQYMSSLGFKFNLPNGMIAIANGLFPIRYGGLQPYVAWTFGLEWGF
jgi:hypothetical protein